MMADVSGLAPAPKDLSARLAAAFGALGGDSGAAPSSWQLQGEVQPFRGGDRELDAYSSDEEEARAAPQPLMPDAFADSDEEVGGSSAMVPSCSRRSRRKGDEDSEDEEDDEAEAARAAQRLQCSAHSRLAFEAEPEEDAFDSFAVDTLRMRRARQDSGGGAADDERPSGAMEVGGAHAGTIICAHRHRMHACNDACMRQCHVRMHACMLGAHADGEG